MVENGGRSTEKASFDNKGNYQIILSTKTFKNPYLSCSEKFIKEFYLGRIIYYYLICQELDV